MLRTNIIRFAAVLMGVWLVLLGLFPSLASADTPTPSPTPSASVSASPTPSGSSTAVPTVPASASPSPSGKTTLSTPCPARVNCQTKGTPPAAENLQAAAPDDGTVALMWQYTGRIYVGIYQGPVTFNVYRDGAKLATIEGRYYGDGVDVRPTNYTDPHPPQGRAVTYYVTTTGTTKTESAASNKISLTPVQFSQSTQASGGAPQSDGGVSLDITIPNFRGNNAPTAFEAYGGIAAGTIHDTYGGPDDVINEYTMFPLQAGYKMLVLFNFVSMVLLAWTVTKQIYQGIILAVTTLIQAIFALDVYHSLVLDAVSIGGLCIVVYAIWARFSMAKRSLAYIAAGLAGIALFTSFAPQVVQDVMTSPTIIGQGILGYSSELSQNLSSNPQLVASRYNISVKPTYNGNQFEQGVRRFQDAEFLNTVYAGTCKETFGDLEWSIHHYVPDRSAKPVNGFHDLTYCEYYIRAEVLGDSTEQSYLHSVISNTAPDKVSQFYQGKDVVDHYGYAIPIGLGLLFRTLLLDLTAFTFAVSIFALGYMLVKAVLLLVGWLVPPFQPAMNRLLKQMTLKVTLPPYMIGALVLGLLLSSIAFNTVGLLGWEGMMMFQFVSGLASLVTGVMIWRRTKGKEKEIRKEPRATTFLGDERKQRSESAASAPSGPPAVQTSPRAGWGSKALQVGAAAYTGGTSAVVSLAANGARQNIASRVATRRQQRSQPPPGGNDASSDEAMPTSRPYDGSSPVNSANRRNIAAGSSPDRPPDPPAPPGPPRA